MIESCKILIMGASRGLGYALAAEYMRRGRTVIATVRDDAGEARLRALGPILVERVDIIDGATIDRLARALRPADLDLIFINAGISGSVEAAAGDLPAEAWGQVMRTNAHAPVAAIERLHFALSDTGTVAVMSSSLGSVALNDRGSWESYRMSKAALNMGLRSVAARIAKRDQAFIAVAPGWVRTDMGGDNAPLSIDESIPGVVDMLAAQAGKGGTRFLDYRSIELPW